MNKKDFSLLAFLACIVFASLWFTGYSNADPGTGTVDETGAKQSDFTDWAGVTGITLENDSTTISSFGATVVDDTSASAARTTMGLGSISTQASDSVAITGGAISGITDLAVADGGTGASTANDARTNLGVDDTSIVTLIDGEIDPTGKQVLMASTLEGFHDETETLLLNARATGVRWGGALTDLGSSTIRIAAGAGQILDNTTPASPTYYSVTWSQTDLDVSGATDGVQYWVVVDNTGTVSYTGTEPTHTEYRTQLPLHRFVIRSGAVSGSISVTQTSQQYSGETYDIWRVVGLAKNTGDFIMSSDGAGGVDISAGEIYSRGVNFHNDATNPNETEFAAQNTATFRLVDQDNDQTADTTTLNVTQYDVAGTLTTMTNNRWGIYTCFIFPNGNLRFLYAQTQYNNRPDAQEALYTGQYSPTIPSNLQDAFQLGWIIFEKGDTTLADAAFISTNRFGGIGGAVASLGSGYVLESDILDLDGVASLTVPNNTTISAFGATLVDDADAATARSTLGLGTASTYNVGTTTGAIPEFTTGNKIIADQFQANVNGGIAFEAVLTSGSRGFVSTTVVGSPSTKVIDLGLGLSGVKPFEILGDGSFNIHPDVSANLVSEIGAASLAVANTYTALNTFNSDVAFDKTITAPANTGAQTINKNAGSVNFAAAATSLVVTNSRVTTNSVIIATVGTNDSTMTSVQAVAGSGSFTLYANAAATAETRVNFIIIN